jgi:mannose-1-phosphate guanylyltransferase
MKALILAAGFGTRLRPVTNKYPKPLCPVFGIPLLDLAYHRVEDAGIKSIAVNTHHLADSVKKHCESNWLNIDLISHEPIIRGTGGSVFPLIDWLEGDDLLIYNGDILSNIDLNQLIEHHTDSRAKATMALLDTHMLGKNPVLTKDHLVYGFGDSFADDGKSTKLYNRHTFTGIHIISNEFAKKIPNTTPWHIIDTYIKFIDAKQSISAFSCNNFWHDLGTPQSYWNAHTDIMKNHEFLLESLGINAMRQKQGLDPLCFDTSCLSIIPKSMMNRQYSQQIIGSVITNHLTIQDDAKLRQCLVFPDVQSIDQQIDQCIVTPYDIVNHS